MCLLGQTNVCGIILSQFRLQAWRNGLQNFLSDAPSLLDKGQGGLSTVTQYASGVVVVDTLQGAALPRHGPAINFWPSVFVMGPENVTRIAF